MTFMPRTSLHTALVAGLAAALFVTAVPAAALAQQETFDRTLSAAPGGTFRLKTFSGRVNIRGTGGNQVIIHAVRRGSAERLREIQIEVRQNGDTIEVDANHRLVRRENDNVVETDFEIQVPASMRLDVTSFSAPVAVNGVQGPHRLKSFSGDIEMNAEAWSESDGLDIDTFSGEVRLRLPGNARGSLSFDSFSGRFDSDLPVTLQSSSRRTFRGELNGGGSATFKVKTFSGSATIKR